MNPHLNKTEFKTSSCCYGHYGSPQNIFWTFNPKRNIAGKSSALQSSHMPTVSIHTIRALFRDSHGSNCSSSSLYISKTSYRVRRDDSACKVLSCKHDKLSLILRNKRTTTKRWTKASLVASGARQTVQWSRGSPARQPSLFGKFQGSKKYCLIKEEDSISEE